MKKFLKQFTSFLIVFLSVFLIGEFVISQTVRAQVEGQCWRIDQNAPMSPVITQEQCVGMRASGSPVEWKEGPAVPASEEAERQQNPPARDSENSAWWQGMLETFFAWISLTILSLASLLTGISGYLLNGVIYHTIVNISENYENIPAINVAWGVVRDVANMGFIFILLYAAIQTILGIGGDNKKIIVNVIIVAILINFSLFITKVVIDISNVLALLFYEAIVGPEGVSVALIDTVLSREGLSNAFMTHLNLTSLYSVGETVGIESIITVGVMGSIMLLVAAFVFFSIAIMFVIRYVVLIFVLILSPLAFLGFVFPEVSKYSNQWREALVGQAFFAPVYFLLTWVTLKILANIMSVFGGSDVTEKNLASIFQTGQGGVLSAESFGMFINFIVIIAFLIITLIISKEWSSKAGSGVSGLTKWATGVAGGATLGVAGRFGRGTIGRAGNAIAESEFLKSRAPNSIAARLALATAKRTGGASFDVRSSAIGNTLDAGKGQKGGFADDLKKKTEADKKYADSLKPSDLLISRAERGLDDAKKTGGVEKIKLAQDEVDRLKGVSEEEATKREVKKRIKDHFNNTGKLRGEKDVKRELETQKMTREKEISRLKKEENLTHEQATKKAEENKIGWAPEKVKGEGVERKEAYAKDQESGSTTIGIPGTRASVTIPHFDITGRILAVGPVKKERRSAANAIRKSIKEKKPGEKIADEIEKQAKESNDDEGGSTPETPPPTPPAGGTPPTP
ncbi:MAG: hypothetical protein WDZ64_00795 [Parcubacteria group bacterium]